MSKILRRLKGRGEKEAIKDNNKLLNPEDIQTQKYSDVVTGVSEKELSALLDSSKTKKRPWLIFVVLRFVFLLILVLALSVTGVYYSSDAGVINSEYKGILLDVLNTAYLNFAEIAGFRAKSFLPEKIIVEPEVKKLVTSELLTERKNDIVCSGAEPLIPVVKTEPALLGFKVKEGFKKSELLLPTGNITPYAFSDLTFYLKAVGFENKDVFLEIYFMSGLNRVTQFTAYSGSGWQKVTLPLARFQGMKNISFISGLGISVINADGSLSEAAIHLKDISLVE